MPGLIDALVDQIPVSGAGVVLPFAQAPPEVALHRQPDDVGMPAIDRDGNGAGQVLSPRRPFQAIQAEALEPDGFAR